jgi:Tryptophan halogenase
MRIGIIGGGTASAISAIAIVNAAITNVDRFHKNISIACIYDPNIPITHVGESTSPLFAQCMLRVFDVDFLEDLDKFDGTLRYYNKYFWSETGGEDFSVYHNMAGIHVNSEKFSNYIIDTLEKQYPLFTKIHDTVISTTSSQDSVTVTGLARNYNFDYVIDCRGTPSQEELNSELYEKNVFQSVNSAILYPDFTKYDEPFTSTHFHENGWMFGVPLQHRKAWGYLYDKNITSHEDASEHFAKLKGVDTTNLRRFNWEPYYKKTAMDGRILYLGNKLYFFEPTQAIPLNYYFALTDLFMNNAKVIPLDALNFTVNDFHKWRIEQIQNSIALVYVGDTSFQSEFWHVMKSRALDRLRQSYDWQLYIDRVSKENKIGDYFLYSASLMKNYIEGFKIDLTKLKTKTY